MIELFGNVKIDWLGKRRIFLATSIVLLLVGMASIATRGLRYGVDFQGGTILTVRFEQPVPIDDLRNLLAAGGVPEGQIQELRGADEGFDVLIQVEQGLIEEDLDRGRQLIGAALDTRFAGQYEILNSESVGPKAGADLRRQAVLATIYALCGILVYIAFRFEWIYGAAAVLAVTHDALITLGLFSIFGREINLTVIAALLTLVGYSVNDTIVVFDRLRENLKSMRRVRFEDVLNTSINQTLSRTVLTSALTMVAALSMYLFGGDVINNFAFTLVVGVLIGAYSSVAVAAPMVLIYSTYRQRQKEQVRAAGKLARPLATK